MQLENKVVIITGAKGGLGTFVTTAFLEAGARVVGVSRSISASDFAHERFSAIPAELSNGESARKIADAVLGEWGRIDGLVHLMGGFAGGQSVVDTSDGTLDRMFDLNLRSAFYAFRAVLPHMRAQESGRIIAIGSKAAVEPSPMVGAYAASKAALLSLVRTVARENSDSNVTANIVLPGTMDTPANRKATPDADFAKWVNPDHVAKLVVYLASAAGVQITGVAIPIDGGQA